MTNPSLSLAGSPNDHSTTKLSGAVSASATPLVSQHSQGHGQLSRRSSPSGLLEGLNSRSVPATPLGISSALLKTPGTPLTADPSTLNGRLASHQLGDAINPGDLQASLSRLPAGQYDLDDSLQVSVYSGLYRLNSIFG